MPIVPRAVPIVQPASTPATAKHPLVFVNEPCFITMHPATPVPIAPRVPIVNPKTVLQMWNWWPAMVIGDHIRRLPSLVIVVKDTQVRIATPWRWIVVAHPANATTTPTSATTKRCFLIPTNNAKMGIREIYV